MLEESLKKINELSFKSNVTNDIKEKEKLEDDIKAIITDLKKQAIESFKSESDIKKFLDNADYVAPLRTFNKMGYRIKANEKGIKILIPNFYTIVKIKTNEEGKYILKPLFSLNDEEKEKYKNKNDDTITYYSQKLSNFKIGSVFDASQTTMPLDTINEKLNPVLEDDRANGMEDNFIKAIYRLKFVMKKRLSQVLKVIAILKITK